MEEDLPLQVDAEQKYDIQSSRNFLRLGERKGKQGIDCRSIIICHSVIYTNKVWSPPGMALAERLITSLSCCACVMLAGGEKDSKGLQIDPSSYVTVLYKYKEGCGGMQ